MFNLSARTWLTLYFISFLFIWGMFLPFWGVWLASKGVSPEQIGTLLAFGLLLRFVSNLTLLPCVNCSASVLRLLRTLGFISLILFSSLLYWQGYRWLALATLLINFIMAPMTPLADIIGTRLVNQIGLDYGRVRLWGSLSFMVGSTYIGWLMVDNGAEVILWMILAACLVMWLLSLSNFTPKLIEPSALIKPQKNILWALLKTPNVQLFLIIVGTIQGSHGAYYAFSAIYWNSIGFSTTSIAWLWSIGVFAEVIVMHFNRLLFSKWSIKQMLLLGLIAAIVRWLVTANSDNIYLLGLVQTLHALTFAVTHLATIRYIALQQKEQMVAYQSLYSGIALGLVMAIFTYIAGVFYAPLQAGVFLIMSILLLPVIWCLKIWQPHSEL